MGKAREGVMELVTATGGMTAPELGELIGVDRFKAERMLNKLGGEGLLRVCSAWNTRDVYWVLWTTVSYPSPLSLRGESRISAAGGILRSIVSMLQQSDPNYLKVSDFAKELDLPKEKVRPHLRQLEEEGVIYAFEIKDAQAYMGRKPNGYRLTEAYRQGEFTEPEKPTKPKGRRLSSKTKKRGRKRRETVGERYNRELEELAERKRRNNE
jgi:predicted ArsR family transcriptional regulator